MARTSTFDLYDRVLEGKLAETLTAWRNDDVPVDEMVFRLRTRHDVSVSRSTVRRWFDIVDGEADDGPEAA